MERQPPKRDVRVLPNDLSNQIAAGEVVERPASAVKELVENALDAGATKIFVDLDKGGRTLIRVTDNGTGMSRDNVTVAVRRHATSKIATLDDLTAIRTLGFRGEALPSIASVSKFRILTKPADEMVGTELIIEGGNQVSVKDAAAADGTQIEVRDLFYNTPARLKFLKRDATELRRVQAMVMRLALVWHEVHFRLRHGGRKRLDVPPHSDPKDRVYALLGKEVYEQLHPLPELPAVEGVTARGFFGDPSHHVRGSSSLYTYVNGRYVNDRTIAAAIQNSYRDLLPKGRSPVVVLQVDVPPDLVDVNVHPAKTEVRFRDPDPVFRAVYRGLREGLSRAPWAAMVLGDVPVVSSAGPDGAMPTPVSITMPMGPLPTAAQHAAPLPLGTGNTSQQWVEHILTQNTPPAPATPASVDAASAAPEPATSAMMPVAGSRAQSLTPTAAQLAMGGMGDAPTRGASIFARLRFIGQLAKAYLLATDGGHLVIVHQHAAHERITFERLKHVWNGRTAETQRLLFPLQIELDALRAATLEEHLELFQKLGFEIEPFGRHVFALKAVPALIAGARYLEVVKDAIDELSNIGRTQRVTEAIDKVLGRMARFGAVRSGDALNAEEAEALFRQLDAIDFKTTSPYGRKVLVSLPLAELEQRFAKP